MTATLSTLFKLGNRPLTCSATQTNEVHGCLQAKHHDQHEGSIQTPAKVDGWLWLWHEPTGQWRIPGAFCAFGNCASVEMACGLRH